MALLSTTQLQFSRHNILGHIPGTEESYIVNLLTGHADILSKEKADEIALRRFTDMEEYASRGYLADPAEEERLFRTRYADFIDRRDKDEVQIFFVPWYSCNFGCSYCYQDEYGHQAGIPGDDVVAAFFAHVQRQFAGRRKYLTVFGGEPLLPGEAHRQVVRRLLEGAEALGMETAFVTNGYTLAEYAQELGAHRIREVQVTLDGLPEMHNLRRPLKGGGATFERVVEGIDAALNAGLTINLRVVVDRDNIGELPALARLAKERGWTANARFKTQLGRNYELHHCQSGREKLLTRLQMFESLYTLIRENPDVLEFHKPAFSIAKFLFENGELPTPLYDACPGTKTEWAFDATGKIYSCTATVGKTEEALGTFYPVSSLDEERVERWEERDVTAIPECGECALRLACGGGCASVAFNRTGNLHAPDCRPVRELIGMGISLYSETERA